MPTIIDQNGQKEVTQQEYDIYIASISPTLQQLKEYKIQELENITREHISKNIYFEIEKSVRTSQPLPTWVNDFVNAITEKNHNLKLQINLCLTINELNLIDGENFQVIEYFDNKKYTFLEDSFIFSLNESYVFFSSYID